MAGLADGENAEKDDALGDTASIEKKYILNVIGICKLLQCNGSGVLILVQQINVIK